MTTLSTTMVVMMIIPSEKFCHAKFDRYAPYDRDHDYSSVRRRRVEKDASSLKTCKVKAAIRSPILLLGRTPEMARYVLLHIPDFAH